MESVLPQGAYADGAARVFCGRGTTSPAQHNYSSAGVRPKQPGTKPTDKLYYFYGRSESLIELSGDLPFGKEIK